MKCFLPKIKKKTRSYAFAISVQHCTRDSNQGNCCCSVTKSCPTLCGTMNCNTPGFHILHYLLVFAQTHVHWVDDAIQLSHPLLFQLSILLSSRVFSNESILRTRWSKFWSFSFSISPSKEYLGLIYMYTSNSWGRSPF